MTQDNRRFQRIPFDAVISLKLLNSEKPITGNLHDISLKGALIVADEPYTKIDIGQKGELIITPEQTDLKLTIECEVSYELAVKHSFGLNILSMDVETASHLRRLVELNLGDESQLQRELSNLVSAMEAEHLQ